jgi:hypothetical protein
MDIEKVKFYNNKITINHWVEEDENWEEDSIKDLEVTISELLRSPVEFSEDLTIYGFMKQLEPFVDEIDELFVSSSLGYSLKKYLDVLDKKTKKDDFVDNINFVEFYWSAEIYDDEFTEYCSFHGIGLEDEISYGLDFSPIYKWCHLPFVLNTDYEIYNLYKNNEPIMILKKDFTVYNLLDGFIYELTFNGSPDEQLEEFEKILSEIEDIKEHPEEYATFDELKLEQLELKLKKCIENEDYETAQEIKEEINKINKK